MPKRYSSSDCEKVAKRLGYGKSKRKGNDESWTRPNSLPVVIPRNKSEIPAGTFGSILRQFGLSRDEFDRVLNKGGAT